MLYTLICLDKPGALDIRKANRDAHLAYIKDTGVVEQAGPFLDADDQMIGSLVVLNVASQTEADAWAAADPYAKADLFDSVTIRPWKRVVG